MNSGRALALELRNADDFYPLDRWPVHLKTLLFRAHKNRRDRFTLWHFLFHNGLPPTRCTRYVMWHNTYNPSAWDSIRDLELKAQTRPQWFRQYNVFDMQERQVIRGVGRYYC